MTRDELIEAMATSEAAYDGRTFAGLSAPEKARYRDRCKANLSAIEASGHAIVPVEATPEMIGAAWTSITPEKQRQGIARLGPGPSTTDVYRAMIAAGRI